MNNNSIVKTEQNGNGQLAVAPYNDDADFEILDVYSDTGVKEETPGSRKIAIATISAGYKDDRGIPQRSKNGEIYLHGNAPGLAAALAETKDMRLTVAFAYNQKTEFIQQRFTEYSASQLKTFGDGKSITEILPTGRMKKQGTKSVPEFERHVHLKGTDEYITAMRRCKVSCSVYFALARWVDGKADIYFPDGVGLYRIRFTSRGSLSAFDFAVTNTKGFTKGVVAGIPFDIFLSQEEGADGDGMRRKNWIWQVRTSTENGDFNSLNVAKYRELMDHGQSQIKMLELGEAQQESIEDAIVDEPLADVSGDTIDAEVVSESSEVAEPTPEPAKVLCDKMDCQKKYFAMVKGSYYGTNEGRAEFVSSFTDTDSLSAFLKIATPQVADAFFVDLTDALKKEANTLCSSIVGKAKRIFGNRFKDQLAGELGQANFDGMTADQLTVIDNKFDTLIDEMNAMQSDVTEPALETPSNPLNKAVHVKIEDAKTATVDDEDDDPFADYEDPLNTDENGEVIE